MTTSNWPCPKPSWATHLWFKPRPVRVQNFLTFTTDPLISSFPILDLVFTLNLFMQYFICPQMYVSLSLSTHTHTHTHKTTHPTTLPTSQLTNVCISLVSKRKKQRSTTATVFKRAHTPVRARASVFCLLDKCANATFSVSLWHATAKQTSVFLAGGGERIDTVQIPASCWLANCISYPNQPKAFNSGIIKHCVRL